MSTENRLKPCPFCGGAAKEFERFNANVITCRRCGVKVKQSEMGEGDAAVRWNQRATPVAAQAQQPVSGADGLPALVEYLRQEADFNRSWADGRRGSTDCQSPEYITRRMVLAARADTWADAVAGLIATQPFGNSGKLPPLPQGISQHGLIGHDSGVYTDAHMVDYALAALAQQDADTVDAERYRAWRDALITGKTAEDDFIRLVADSLPTSVGVSRRPTAAEWDAAIDAARKEQA